MDTPKGNGRNAAPAKIFTKSTADFIALTTTEARASSQAIAALLARLGRAQ